MATCNFAIVAGKAPVGNRRAGWQPGWQPAPRLFGPVLGLLLAGAPAYAEHLVFTMLTSPSCPVLASAPEQSKDFGFQSVLFRNDSDKSIQTLYLTVTFYTAKSRDREEVVDSAHIYIALEPGEQKRMDVFLGRIQALTQKVKSVGQAVAWVKLFVDSAEYSDGTRWDGNQR